MAKIKTKARALDMLGRQQIAGIPTALSELFKNSHDAYADNVEVDYIRKKNLLILRDDGLGMTREEFEERWLTIGTDSKLVDNDSITPPTIDSHKNLRPVMGEKGIGRLSIAAIGPQVLVLTRAKRGGELHKLVASFINWTLFSLPGLDLDDIEIPLLEVDDGNCLSQNQLQELLSQAKTNVLSLSHKISKDKITNVLNQIDSFDYNPEIWAERLKKIDQRVDAVLESSLNCYPRKLYLDNDGFGTHFIISPVDEILAEEVEQVDTNKPTDQASRLDKALLGFTNTMYKSAKPPVIGRFRDHTIEGEMKDRISESIFFTPEEFDKADHHFEGTFNEFGQFEGKITVYGEEKQKHVIPWPGGLNKQVLCGAFKIKLATIMGTARESKLPQEIWKELWSKTNRIGGLYLYRDGIRVLPYGDSDFDFLHIEQRRSKSAKEYFFSFRRMFGAVELTKEFNSSLYEKAGREGFIENKAYKQFKAILENFFIQIAADFFNDKGDLSELFMEKRAREQELDDLLKKREGLKRTKKRRLEEKLNKFFDNLDNDYWAEGISVIQQRIKNKFENFSNSEMTIDDFVFDVQHYLDDEISKLDSKLTITLPAGVGFGKALNDLWDRYQIEKNKIEGLINNLKDEIGRRLVEYEDQYGNRTGLRRRFNDSLDAQSDFQKKRLNERYSKVQNDLEALQKWIKDEINSNRREARDNLDQVKHDFSSISFDNKASDELFQIKKSLEEKITNTSSAVIDRIEKLSGQLVTAKGGTDENTLSSNQLTAVLESEYEHLKELNEQNAEMVHLGMAIGVIHHEFNGNIRGIRSALREMQPWANKNEKLNVIFNRIRTGFDHLDGYLKTFTPLTRRLVRKKIKITGQAICEFVTDVFHDRLSKEEIELNCTNEFLSQNMIGLTSTIYPAFVNLIDNSIYWLGKSTGKRCITLDASEDGFVIKDNGPGIPSIDQENVFEFAFSRKIGGRGMGLYVTRQTLGDDGFNILLGDYNPNEGAYFTISPKKTDDLD
jgi:signal transduction histidine kinase